jgi:hypothetical protein
MPRRRLVKFSFEFTVPAIVYSTSTWVNSSCKHGVRDPVRRVQIPCYMVPCTRRRTKACVQYPSRQPSAPRPSAVWASRLSNTQFNLAYTARPGEAL